MRSVGILEPHSQTHILRRRLEEAGVSHGAEVRADLRGVRVMMERQGPVVFFCDMAPNSVRIRHVVRRGDGGALPPVVKLKGFGVPEDANYLECDLVGVMVRANSRVIVEVVKETRVVELV